MSKPDPQLPPRNQARPRLGVSPRGQVLLLLLHLAAGAAWLSGDDHARLAAAILAAPLLVDWLATLISRPRLAIRVAPRRSHARAPFLESIEVINLSPSVAIRDLRIHEARTQVFDSGGALLPYLAPGTRTHAQLAARSPRRGRWLQREFEIGTAWPLGLFRWSMSLPVAVELLCEPSRGQLPLEAARALAADHHDPLADGRVDQTELHSLREYRYGEDARRVHGRRSASLGTLVIQVLQGSPDPELSLIVDLRRGPGLPLTTGVQTGFESQLSRAAAICDALCREHQRFRAAVIAERTLCFEGEPDQAGADLLAELAVAQSHPWRPLSEEERELLPGAERHLWVTAGGWTDSSLTGGIEACLIEDAAS